MPNLTRKLNMAMAVVLIAVAFGAASTLWRNAAANTPWRVNGKSCDYVISVTGPCPSGCMEPDADPINSVYVEQSRFSLLHLPDYWLEMPH